LKVVITDGVFSMDGDTAKLAEMVALCDKYDAMLFVDDSSFYRIYWENRSGNS